MSLPCPADTDSIYNENKRCLSSTNLLSEWWMADFCLRLENGPGWMGEHKKRNVLNGTFTYRNDEPNLEKENSALSLHFEFGQERICIFLAVPWCRKKMENSLKLFRLFILYQSSWSKVKYMTQNFIIDSLSDKHRIPRSHRFIFILFGIRTYLIISLK